MRCSGASGDVTGAATKTIIALISTSTRYGEIEQIIFGSSATPADAVAKFALREITAAGTSTAGTTFNLDRNGGAPSCLIKVNYTAEPTYASGNLFEIDVNQRATFPWTVPPGLRTLMGTDKGLGIQMISGPAVAWNITVVWNE